VDQDGKNYVTPSQAFAVEQVIRQNPSPEDQKIAQQKHEDALTTARNMDKETLYKYADELGVSTKDKSGDKIDRALIAKRVADKEESDYIESRVKDRTQASLPYPVKNLPEAKLNMPTTTTPAKPGQPIPTGASDIRGGIVPQPTSAQAAGKSPGPADLAGYKAAKPGDTYKGVDGKDYVKGG
jgi:hypothetical protein